MENKEPDNGSSNIKKSVMSGLGWTYAERIAAQGVSFIISLVLARLLSPDHYGTIAIVTIFISICNVFVVSGLGSSLVQKKDADELDFSTVFHSSFIMSCLLYGLMFLVSPLIADYYEMPELVNVLRVMSLRLPLAALNTVQHSYVSKHLLFKKFFFSTLFGTIISAAIGIVCAYMGFGVWALVIQYLTNTVVDSIVLLFTIPWRPKLEFSFVRFKSLFSYGWKILLSDLIQTVYNDIRSLIIGKRYSSADLAFYNKGQQFTNIIVVNVNTSITKVFFPVVAKYQDNKETVKRMMKKSIKISVFIMAPLLVGLAVVAEPLITIILTEKWISCVPYIQILCIANVFQPMNTTNLQVLKAMGHSDIVLKLEIIKKTYSIAVLVLSVILFDNPIAIAVGFAITVLMSTFVNAIPNKKIFNYSYGEQLLDLLPSIGLTLLMGCIVILVGYLSIPIYIKLILQILVGGIVYIGGAWLFKIESFTYLLNIFKSKRK